MARQGPGPPTIPTNHPTQQYHHGPVVDPIKSIYMKPVLQVVIKLLNKAMEAVNALRYL